MKKTALAETLNGKARMFERADGRFVVYAGKIMRWKGNDYFTGRCMLATFDPDGVTIAV